MNIIKNASLLFLLLIPFQGYNQNSINDSLKYVTAAMEIITSAHTCTFITLDDEGRSQARMLETLKPNIDFTLWFGTNPRSRKVKQIKKDARVTVYYADAMSTGYVVIQGLAFLVNGTEEKEQHWKDGWQSYYPDRENDFILIKVIPETLEIVSYMHGIVGDTNTWKAPVIIFNNTD